MVAAILIVGDDPVLLQTRADLLREWQVSTSTSQQAFQSIRASAFDLLVICQTVPDFTAGQLIDKGREMNSSILVLAMSRAGQQRNLDAELFEVQLGDPDRLRRAVTHLLQQVDSWNKRTWA
jgi:CheY-like chemotaxis protein